MENIYKSEVGKHEVLVQYQKILASWPVENHDLAFSSLTFYFKPRTAKMPLFSNESLSNLTMPILMLFGNSDQLIPAVKSIKRLKQFAQQAKIELLPDTGHLIVNQADRILNFLKNNE